MAENNRPSQSTPSIVPEVDPDTAGTEKDFPPPDPKNAGRGTADYKSSTRAGPGQDPSIEEGTETKPRDPENPERPATEPEEWKHSVGPGNDSGGGVAMMAMTATSGYIDRQDFRRR